MWYYHQNITIYNEKNFKKNKKISLIMRWMLKNSQPKALLIKQQIIIFFFYKSLLDWAESFSTPPRKTYSRSYVLEMWIKAKLVLFFFHVAGQSVSIHEGAVKLSKQLTSQNVYSEVQSLKYWGTPLSCFPPTTIFMN